MNQVVTGIEAEDYLAKRILKYKHDPLGFAKFAFEWGAGELAKSTGPYKWQTKAFEDIREHLQNPATRHHPCRLAVCSGHGIGKSAFIAMLINWGMSTCIDCRVIVTANTYDQLATKTAPESSKWFRLAINAHWWNAAATSIKAKDDGHEQTWRTDFIPWSAQRPQAFAGLHNKGKRIIVVFDEASEIDDIIWETVTGVMSDQDTEIIWCAFGNPTQAQGRFFECWGRFAARWKKYRIDSREVEGTNKEEIAADLEDWGEDSDFFRVRWRGEFPRVGTNKFIAPADVAKCRKYKAEGYESLPKCLSVDVARFGADQTVIGVRQGRKLRILDRLRGLDQVQVAEHVIKWIEAEKPQGVVIDADGMGAGPVDIVRARGYRVEEFHGGGKAHDSAAYFNRRAEVWGLMRDALMAGMEIPDDPELEMDLTGPQYGFSNKQQIQLEKKDDMKKRGLSSPDAGDMFAMTFAVTLAIQPPREEYAPPFAYHESGWMA